MKLAPWLAALFASVASTSPCFADAPPAKLDVSALLGTTPNFGAHGEGGLALGVDAHWHVLPMLRVGAYAMHALSWTALMLSGGDVAIEEGTAVSAVRYGLHAELHAAPTGGADPFLGVGFGVLHMPPVDWVDSRLYPTGGTGADLSLDAGLDFHAGAHVAPGIVATLVVPIDAPSLAGGLAYEPTYRPRSDVFGIIAVRVRFEAGW